MADQWERTIRCEDSSGRERAVRVFPSADNRAVIQVPAGESGILNAVQFGQLRTAMDQLAVELSLRVDKP